MSGQPVIQYLPHNEVNREKWDACIERAPYSLIYAHSFYLDHMARHWDALVMNDYDAVMPLTWHKKYGIKYLYQPFLTAQLGVFGQEINESLVKAFIRAIPAAFRYIDIMLNHRNFTTLPGMNMVQRVNYTLALDRPYEELYAQYRENTRRNMKKALQAGCQVQKGFDPETVIRLAKAQTGVYGPASMDNLERFRKLYGYLHARQQATTYGISLGNEMVSSCVFFFARDRAYYILVGNHPNGKTIGASHLLIDAFIKDHAGKKMILDFEGSDIRNLAFFYSSYGAKEEIYPALKINRLPFYLRWLKK